MPRDPEKTEKLVEFYLAVTPPAEEILSGEAIRKRLEELSEKDS